MTGSHKIRVLSLNTYIMGHVTYHDMLEKTFREYIPNIEFDGVKLNGYPQSIFNRVLYRLLTLPVPGLDKQGWDYMRLRLELGASYYARTCLNELLKKQTPDVLHIHTQGIALLATPIFRRIPSVVNIDYTSALLAKEHPQPANATYKPIIALERRCFAAAKHILTWNNRARESVIADYAIEPTKVTTVHPAVPLDLFLQLTRGKHPQNHKPRLLFVGNDFERKGGSDLVELFSEELSNLCELDIVTNAAVTLPSVPGLSVAQWTPSTFN